MINFIMTLGTTSSGTTIRRRVTPETKRGTGGK